MNLKRRSYTHITGVDTVHCVPIEREGYPIHIVQKKKNKFKFIIRVISGYLKIV